MTIDRLKQLTPEELNEGEQTFLNICEELAENNDGSELSNKLYEKRIVEYYRIYSESINKGSQKRLGIIIDLYKNKKNNVCFITINPPQEIEFKNFYKLVKKSISKKWINDSLIYVFEQRGETKEEAGKGFHAHILFKRGKKIPSEIMREFKKTFKNIMNVNNTNLLNFVFTNEEYYEDKKQYITGDKKQEKQQKQKIDIIWREKNDIEPYYTK